MMGGMDPMMAMGGGMGMGQMADPNAMPLDPQSLIMLLGGMANPLGQAMASRGVQDQQASPLLAALMGLMTGGQGVQSPEQAVQLMQMMGMAQGMNPTPMMG